jgi:acyl-CoA hydrolase
LLPVPGCQNIQKVDKLVAGTWVTRVCAVESTYVDKDGNLKSRIVPTLEPGTAVTVPRHTIHWVVTEYGMTNLKGLSTWERAEEMVRLAHPKFRDELLKEAEKLGIWRRTNRRALDA